MAPLRRFRNTAATARAALNAAAIKANVDSDVTADDLRDRAMRSFPTHPIRECRQFYPKICKWSRAMSGIARGVANLAVAPSSEIKHFQRLVTHESMQAPLRFLQCFALNQRRSVAVFRPRGQGYNQPSSSFGAATSLNAQQKRRRASRSAPLVRTNLTKRNQFRPNLARRPAKPVRAKPSRAAVVPLSGVVTGVPLKTKTWLRPN